MPSERAPRGLVASASPGADALGRRVCSNDAARGVVDAHERTSVALLGVGAHGVGLVLANLNQLLLISASFRASSMLIDPKAARLLAARAWARHM